MEWHDKEPIYQQLKNRIAASIMEGALPECEAIPSIRQVCSEYQINPMTVSKAYQALVDESIIEKKRGVGMYVAEGARQRLLQDQKALFLSTEWPSVLEKMKRLGLTLEELPQ